MPHSNDVANGFVMTPEEMLLDLDTHYSSQMTEWQAMFVASMLDHRDDAAEIGVVYKYTLRQVSKIAEIYQEKDEEE